MPCAARRAPFAALTDGLLVRLESRWDRGRLRFLLAEAGVPEAEIASRLDEAWSGETASPPRAAAALVASGHLP